MAASEHQKKLLYSLTSLQIGDMQSYISKLYLHADYDGEKLVFFVDNGPWTAERSRRSKPVELWQLMVTQSRTSPFANRSLKYELIDNMHSRNQKDLPSSPPAEQLTLKRRLFQRDRSCSVKCFRDLFSRRLRSVVSIQELSHLLYGCVTFELEWKDVRGINYLNELQTDTCVSLELKSLVKRDFCDIESALSFYSIDPHEAFSANSHVTSALRNFDSRLNLEFENSFVGANGELSSPASSFFDEFFSDVSDVGRESCCGNSHICHYDSDSNNEVSYAACKLDDAVPSNTGSCTSGLVNTGVLNANLCGKCGCRVEGPSSIEAAFMTSEASSHLFSCEVNMEHPMDEGSGHLPSLEEESWHSMNLGTDHMECVSAAPYSPRELNLSDDGSLSSSLQNEDDEEELFVYQDVLLIFRFCDPILPLDLKEIITADQRLLKMLESGLPSWVIFLQSYPIVRKLYRPWMRPLAKTMYILVSIITVIIGFYDLYKNVPVLKATAARICGPFFDWIEAWEMVSRIKYLGTVLFLQNWEKAFRWLLLVFRTMRKLANLLLQPMIEPLEELAEFVWPLWNLVFDSVWGLTSVLCVVCSSIVEYINFIFELIILPIFWLLTAIWTLVTWVLYPFIYAVWGVIVLPVRLLMLLAEFVVVIVCSLYNAIQNFWRLINSFIQLFSVAGGPQAGKTANASASTLRLLWNDIFSQVFRAIRSIVNVFVAFFITCNRHRLSIYKHVEAFVFQLRCLVKCAPARVACHEPLDTPMLSSGSFEDQRLRRSLRGSGVGSSPRQRRRKGSLTGK